MSSNGSTSSSLAEPTWKSNWLNDFPTSSRFMCFFPIAQVSNGWGTPWAAGSDLLTQNEPPQGKLTGLIRMGPHHSGYWCGVRQDGHFLEGNC